MASPDEYERRKFLYEDIVRALQRQSTVLAELRGRANILLAANAVVASLFGPTVLSNPHPLALAIGSLVLFATGVSCCIAVLWAIHDHGPVVDPDCWAEMKKWPSKDRPRRWRVTFAPKTIEALLDGRGPLRLDADEYKPFRLARRTNHQTISRRTRFFQAGCVLLACQIGLWTWLVFAQPSSPMKPRTAQSTARGESPDSLSNPTSYTAPLADLPARNDQVLGVDVARASEDKRWRVGKAEDVNHPSG